MWNSCNRRNFGERRWPALRSALADPANQLAFVSPTLSPSGLRLLRRRGFLPSGIPNCFRVPSNLAEGGEPEEAASFDAQVAEELRLKTYFLGERTHLLLEETLALPEAPGGKSLVLGSAVFGMRLPSFAFAFSPSDCAFSADAAAPGPLSEREDACNCNDSAKPREEALASSLRGVLVCNEGSRPRFARLESVLTRFLPQSEGGGRTLHLTNADACTGGHFERYAPFDKILVDAPCSSDRHLLQKGLTQTWSQNTPKTHAERQLKMLERSAKLLTPKGGDILYSTCSLSPVENDLTVEKFLKKFKGKAEAVALFEEIPPFVKIVDFAPPDGGEEVLKDEERSHEFVLEKTKHGFFMLPDKSGFGPLYMSKLRVTRL